LHLVGLLLIHYGTVMSAGQKAAWGSAGHQFSGGFGGNDWLAGLLRDATGIDDVSSEDRPEADASVMVRIEAIGSQSTERLSLWWRPGGLALGTWPAELKGQAKATYRTGRAQRIVDFAAGNPASWQIRPNVYLAYRFAAVRQRVYLTCNLGLEEYVRGWLGEDFDYVRGHHRDEVRPILWPWLLERGYASAADDTLLPGFLDRLGKRDAHLRPGIGLQRSWNPTETANLDESNALAGEVRAAVTEVLDVLDEPLPPACTAKRP
jgi:hypothetical protein